MLQSKGGDNSKPCSVHEKKTVFFNTTNILETCMLEQIVTVNRIEYIYALASDMKVHSMPMDTASLDAKVLLARYKSHTNQGACAKALAAVLGAYHVEWTDNHNG